VKHNDLHNCIALITNSTFIQVQQPICWQGCTIISYHGQWDSTCSSPKYCHNSRRCKLWCSFH